MLAARRLPLLAVAMAAAGTIAFAEAPAAVTPPARSAEGSGKHLNPKQRIPSPGAAATPTRQVAVTVTVVPASPTVQRFWLDQNVPNPFSSSTEIRFAVPKRVPCTVRVYNVFGRRVATLAKGTYGPGEYTIQWDGTDDRGRRLRAGVYFCRAEAGRFYRSRKLIIVR